MSLSDRKLLTYINALIKAGFAIDEMVEESDDEIIQLHNGGCSYYVFQNKLY